MSGPLSRMPGCARAGVAAWLLLLAPGPAVGSPARLRRLCRDGPPRRRRGRGDPARVDVRRPLQRLHPPGVRHRPEPDPVAAGDPPDRGEAPHGVPARRLLHDGQREREAGGAAAGPQLQRERGEGHRDLRVRPVGPGLPRHDHRARGARGRPRLLHRVQSRPRDPAVPGRRRLRASTAASSGTRPSPRPMRSAAGSGADDPRWPRSVRCSCSAPTLAVAQGERPRHGADRSRRRRRRPGEAAPRPSPHGSADSSVA